MPTYTSYGSPNVTYAVSVSMTRTSATTATVSVSCATNLGHSSSWLGKGHTLIGSLWIPGVGERTWTIKGSSEVWNGNSAHYSSSAWGISVGPEVTWLSGFQFAATNTYGNAGDLGWQSGFGVSVASGVPSAQTNHNGVTIEGNALTQAEVIASVENIPQNVGYARTISWYLGSELIKSESVTSASHSCSFIGLHPNTTYSLKAVIKTGSSAVSTKTVSVTTPQETGVLAVIPYPTYLKAQITEMFGAPNYSRSIEIHYKKKSDSNYSYVATIESQDVSASANITGLISNAEYDVKAVIKNGANTLKTLTGSAVTTQDTSLIPTPDIVSISQQLGTRNITIDWITDKNIAGTVYEIQAKGTSWTTLATVSEVGAITILSPYGNADVEFRISAKNESVVSQTTNYSDIETFYVRDDFVWDSPKVRGGALVITANEWNRLREYAVARCSAIGVTANIPMVRTGEAITAQTYNIMKNAISQVNNVNVQDKSVGDAISAADVDALRIAINIA